MKFLYIFIKIIAVFILIVTLSIILLIDNQQTSFPRIKNHPELTIDTYAHKELDKSGTIEKGKWANFNLTYENPLDNL